MFMVLSSWQSHCESSPGSFDECRMAPSGRRPKTKPDDLVEPPAEFVFNYGWLSNIFGSAGFTRTGENVAELRLVAQFAAKIRLKQ